MTHQDWFNILTIIAIVVGPIAAVFITRAMDDRKIKYDRRMSVFRDLMRTRRMRLSQVHVSALNVVEIEFYGEKEVAVAWKKYWTSLSRQLDKLSPEEVKAHLQEQERLLTRLLDAMAKSLKFNIEQLEILEGGYNPQLWATLEQQQQALLTLLIDLLSGNRAIPFTTLAKPTPSNPYPPAPVVEDNATPSKQIDTAPAPSPIITIMPASDTRPALNDPNTTQKPDALR